jgi:hypothetical protein
MLVFSGVVAMISGSVTLNLSSRQRTVGVTLAQKYLNEYLASTTNVGACSPAPRITGSPEVKSGAPGCDAKGELKDVSKTCYWISIDSLGTDAKSSLGLTDTNFIKIVSHAKWYSRFSGEQEYQVSRIVRN